MASVDLHGDPLTNPNEPSALFRFLRLLANTNEPMDCTIDLIFIQIPFSFGNLAVSVLELVADMNPETAAGAASILSLLIDNDIAEFSLDIAVGTNVCPTLTNDVVDDLVAVDVLTEPQAYDLLSVVVGILGPAKDDGQTNHIPDIADTVQLLHEAGGTEPLEELFRDIGTQPLLADLVEVVPILATPEAYGLTAGTEPAVDLANAIWLLDWAMAVDPETGRTGIEWLRPILRPVLIQQGTWDALDRASGLMRDETSDTSQLLDLLPPLLELDPDLVLLDNIGALLGERAIAAPLLRALESQGVLQALLAETPADGQPEVPLAFLGRLIADGTFDALLGLLDLLLDDLGGEFLGTEATEHTGPATPAD
jgi:hypothetical protein